MYSITESIYWYINISRIFFYQWVSNMYLHMYNPRFWLKNGGISLFLFSHDLPVILSNGFQ